jgi:hypothetical protein
MIVLFVNPSVKRKRMKMTKKEKRDRSHAVASITTATKDHREMEVNDDSKHEARAPKDTHSGKSRHC